MEDNTHYCYRCDWFFTLLEVEGDVINDPRCPYCGGELQSPPDPPYDHTGHDTLEEKRL